MSEARNIVAIIAARGGSKRLPRKNILPLAGKPLITYTIEAAKGSQRLSRIIVSTDDSEIAKVATDHGAEVPFMRPPELARDESPSIDVVKHATEWLELRGAPIDAVVLLQPTSPLRRCQHIDEAIKMFIDTGVDTVTAVSPAVNHPFWCWQIAGNEIRPYFSRSHVSMRKEMLPPALVENGALYVVRRVVLDGATLYGERIAGYLMNPAEAIDIDTQKDFDRAEKLISHSES